MLAESMQIMEKAAGIEGVKDAEFGRKPPEVALEDDGFTTASPGCANPKGRGENCGASVQDECRDLEMSAEDGQRRACDELSVQDQTQSGDWRRTSASVGNMGNLRRGGQSSRLLAPTKASLAKSRPASSTCSNASGKTSGAVPMPARGIDAESLDKAENSSTAARNLPRPRGIPGGRASGSRNPQSLESFPKDKQRAQTSGARASHKNRSGVASSTNKGDRWGSASGRVTESKSRDSSRDSSRESSRESSPERHVLDRLAAAKRFSEAVKASNLGALQDKPKAGKFRNGKSLAEVKKIAGVEEAKIARRSRQAPVEDKLISARRLPSVLDVEVDGRGAALPSRAAKSGKALMGSQTRPVSGGRLSGNGNDSPAARSKKATSNGRTPTKADALRGQESLNDVNASARCGGVASHDGKEAKEAGKREQEGLKGEGQTGRIIPMDQRSKAGRALVQQSCPSSTVGARTAAAEKPVQEDTRLIESWPPFTNGKVTFWPSVPDQHLKSQQVMETMKGSENKATQAEVEGSTSPVSPLDLRLAEDIVSPVTRRDGERVVSLEDSDLELEPADSDGHCLMLTKSQSKTSSLDSGENLEFASLDFLGDIEGMEQDLEYVRHVLVMSGFAAYHSPPWYSQQLPINPGLFEQLELGLALDIRDYNPARGSEERRQRMLLFDAVNEALFRRLSPHLKVPPWVKQWRPTIRPSPSGRELLQEVWEEIHDWPVPTSDELYDILDDAARRDMTRGLDDWAECGGEEAEVVFELEAAIVQSLLEEVICSFAAVEKNRMAKRAAQSRPAIAAASPVLGSNPRRKSPVLH